MDLTYSNDCFLPYESFDYIYAEREMPEFGLIRSPYSRSLDTWRFFMAKNADDIPMGFDTRDFDDSEWAMINVPSTWQTEGYGLPQNLLYDFSDRLEKDRELRDNSINNKVYYNSSSGDEDPIGVYRTSVVFDEQDIDRAIYLEMSGITGNFEVYLNGEMICTSHSVLTNKRLLLSDKAEVGINCLVILVNLYDRDSNGKIIKELQNFGFAGIFRPLSITLEPLLEMSNFHIKCSNIPNTYVNQLALDETGSERKSVAKISRGDYMIFIDVKITNHTDYMMPFEVRTSVLEARGDYDPYKLPFVKLNIEKQIEGTVDAKSSAVFGMQAIAVNVAQWSDATPVQYDVVLELLDNEGRVICAKKRRFGFRTTEVILDKLNINERRVPLMLTKYYEFDPQNGIAVPLSRMRQDVILMKRCGINGIIVQAFPVSDMLLNLCDQYGLYVFAMADRRYMFDYVETHMIHPSIVCWGFPNYKFDIEKCKTIKNQCEVVDDTRPWYCENDNGQLSDLQPFPSEAGKVFGPWQDICLDRKTIFARNKTGVNLLKSIPGRTNFEDDDADYKWIHQADLEGGKTRAGSSIGQGIVDADRNPHPIYFDIKKQCEMISIFPDPNNPASLTMRNIHPFAYTDELILQWKLLLGGNIIARGNGSVNEIEPYGTRTLKFNLEADKYLRDGWANGNQKYINMYNEALSHELIFDISLKLAKDSFYSKEGQEVAFFQEVLAEEVSSPIATGKTFGALNAFSVKKLVDDGGLPVFSSADLETSSEEPTGLAPIGETIPVVEPAAPSDNMIIAADGEVSATEIMREDAAARGELDIVGMPQGIIVSKDNVSFGFNRTTGSLDHIKAGDFEFLMGGFIPSFYRCPSNIDRTDKSFILAKTIFSKDSDYEAIQDSLEFVGCDYGSTTDAFHMISRYKSFAMKGDVILCYEVFPQNELKITLSFTPKYDMVRYGVRVPVKDEIFCKWYGRGPGESYYDRKNATRFGIYKASAGEIYHPYARPAENSSHTDTSTVILMNEEGDSIRVTRDGEEKFDFTILPYSPEQMNEYLHQEELMQNDYCELFLDFCSKEIERTKTNKSQLPLKKNVPYKETFRFVIKPAEQND